MILTLFLLLSYQYTKAKNLYYLFPSTFPSQLHLL
uniref:Uncharacterized protein n=1 Tax=Rhizophora mucronata TaxID=61149 RepID=A0A2P2QCD1_RHIMU